MTRRYFVAIVANTPPRYKGWGKHVEVLRYRYAKRGGPRRLYVWFFDKAIGTKKLFEFMRHVRDNSSLHAISGSANELARISSSEPRKARGSGRAATSSEPRRGVRRRSLSEVTKKDVERAETPPAAVAKAAREGLALEKDGYGGKGLTSGAIARARILARRGKVSPETRRMMRAWFARHAVDKRPGWKARKTPGWVAWQIWGGDAGRAWVR